MKAGYLSQYFEKVAAKRLSTVEVDSTRSHQHEFNGTKELRETLGTNDSGRKILLQWQVYLYRKRNQAITADGQLSWYDSRFGKPRSAEWRLYFPTTDVTELAKAGDLMIVAKRTDNTVMIIVSLREVQSKINYYGYLVCQLIPELVSPYNLLKKTIKRLILPFALFLMSWV